MCHIILPVLRDFSQDAEYNRSFRILREGYGSQYGSVGYEILAGVFHWHPFILGSEIVYAVVDHRGRKMCLKGSLVFWIIG